MNDKHVSNACLVYESQSVYDVRTCVYEYDTSVCVCSECTYVSATAASVASCET